MAQIESDQLARVNGTACQSSDFFETGIYGTVLIVDDDPAVREIVGMILAEERHIISVSSAGAALALIDGGENFDVILCDIAMPDMDGIDLFEWLQGNYPDQARRMVFITGAAVTQRMLDFLGATENAVIAKPFDAEGMKILVSYLLDGWGLARIK